MARRKFQDLSHLPSQTRPSARTACPGRWAGPPGLEADLTQDVSSSCASPFCGPFLIPEGLLLFYLISRILPALSGDFPVVITANKGLRGLSKSALW